MQRKLNTQKIDFDTLQQKYQSLLRNYEGVSNYAASDKAEYTRLKTGREQAEKEVVDLKKRLDVLELINSELKPQVDNLTLQVNDLKNKNDQKTREIDKLKEELKRKEKGFEDKMNISNCKWTLYTNMVENGRK